VPSDVDCDNGDRRACGSGAGRNTFDYWKSDWGTSMIMNRLAALAVLAMLTFVSLAGPVSAQSSALTPDLLSRCSI
jgi:hypothetical protein